MRQLQERGLTPLQIDGASAASASARPSALPAQSRVRVDKGPVTSADVMALTSELAIMLRAGLALDNSLRVLKNGQIRLQYDKQLLPTYNIFDERRHFEPGADTAKVLRVGNCQVGFLVCEDGWNDQGADYALLDPAQLAARLKQLEAKMHQHARDLEFEEAARVRDEIHRLRTQGLMA